MLEVSHSMTSIYTTKQTIKTACHWQENRHTDQRKRTENAEINPTICGQIIFYAGIKIIMEKRKPLK